METGSEVPKPVTPIKKRLRRITDRVLVPYVDQLREEIRSTARVEEVAAKRGGPNGDAANVPSDRFHNLNHTLRTLALEDAPKGSERVLSIGASGRWYFDWFEQCVGPVREHIGVEAFEAQPDDLPSYVRWVANTADHLDDVLDESVDLVFAGQTTEHLWAHELSGFLLESHRVLRPGGWLVLDSPNRLVTEHLLWSHGGHTVELSLDEISELVQLAGFRMSVQRGIWRCRFGDRTYQLEEGLADDDLTARRIATGTDRPDDCFVWWVEAQRLSGRADPAALERRVVELFERHWATRISRGFWPGPPEHSTTTIAAGSSGVLRSTLPFPLHQGSWELEFELVDGSFDDLDDWSVAIVGPGDELIHELRPADAETTTKTARWTFQQPFLLFALVVELRASLVRNALRVRAPIALRPAGLPIDR